MPEDYALRPTRPEDAEALNALYFLLTGTRRTVEQWRWEWLDGPFGPAPSWVIVSPEGTTVGHHGVVPVPLAWRGTTLNAARTENTMVHPDHRTRFNYPRFEARLLREYLGRFDVIFTTAGKGAQAAVRRRLGYHSAGRWRTYTVHRSPAWLTTRVLGSGAGRLAGWLTMPGRAEALAIETTRDAHRLAALAARAAQDDDTVGGARTAAHLDWRLFKHPWHRYQAAIVNERDATIGWIAWREALGAAGTLDINVDDFVALAGTVDAHKKLFRALAARYSARPARLLVRSLDSSPQLNEICVTHDRSSDGAELLVRSDRLPADAPWNPTMLIAEGI
ncbi:MAG: hypothetical protein ACM3N5_15425 [Candidatus Eiseniibacteriota bacterium]